MGIGRRRSVERTCTSCSETWTVPGALAQAPRVSRRQRGVALRDQRAFRGMDSNAATAMQIELARQRSAALDARMELVSAMRSCPGCGAVGVFTETKGPRS
jgi:hypothetical protein